MVRSVGRPGDDLGGASPEVSGWGLEDSPEMSVGVRDWVIEECLTVVSSPKLVRQPGQRGANVLLSRVWFPGRDLDHHVVVAGDTLERLTVRKCLFTGQAYHNVVALRCGIGTDIEVDHCYLEAANPLSFSESIPRGVVALRNNLRNGAGVACFWGGSEAFAEEADRTWRIEHNAHNLRPDETQKVRLLKRAPTDVALQPRWLSLDLSDRNAYRLAADAPLGSAGTDGSHIGPLPPGPPPANGDWFTRLREWWAAAAPDDRK